MPNCFLHQEILPDVQPQPPLSQHEPTFSCPVASCLGEETSLHISTNSFQEVVESDKVFLDPPFLQAKQPQISQPFLIGLVLKSFHQPCCSSLDLLQYRFSYDLLFRPFTSSFVFLWTDSSTSMSFLN
ncbi:hypothetical protein WISP_116128 [Willisornis vidua]|uniref:Uncharacterized protein n=1 Tax=Willisornis vidua TaxID=1566151 RepID=A0ABQ9CZH9_9PASS|nr:hypothetical protein WISP_116128 [Willisornis vidua]